MKDTGQKKGEGSYEGTQDYNERTGKFLKKNGGRVDEMARDAAEALDENGQELAQAEREGKSHAKS